MRAGQRCARGCLRRQRLKLCAEDVVVFVEHVGEVLINIT
jgi:hypothetical protein